MDAQGENIIPCHYHVVEYKINHQLILFSMLRVSMHMTSKELVSAPASTQSDLDLLTELKIR